jgi:hypothetical protein
VIVLDKSRYGVHQTHCCIKHGCKYGDEDCPVASGEIKQDYVCEWCGEDGVKTVDEIEDFYLDYRTMWEELKTLVEGYANKTKGENDERMYYGVLTLMDIAKENVKNRK